MATVHPVELQKRLSGVEYPASKQDLINHVQGEGAGEHVVEALNELEDREYQNPADVNSELVD